MMCRYIVIIVTISWLASSLYAEETKESQAKGLDAVTDAAGAVVTKAGALLSGNLEITMTGDRDKYANEKNYTVNALGEKVPKSTILKTGKR